MIVTFLDVTLPFDLRPLVVLGFFLSMLFLIGCYWFFYRDIRASNRTMRMYVDRVFAALSSGQLHS